MRVYIFELGLNQEDVIKTVKDILSKKLWGAAAKEAVIIIYKKFRNLFFNLSVDGGG